METDIAQQKITVIEATHPQFGENPEQNSLFLNTYRITGDQRIITNSRNLRWQGSWQGVNRFRDTDGNFKPLDAIAERHNAIISPDLLKG